MKANLLLIGASVMIVLASCNSTRQATSGTSDDVYVSKTESTPPPPAVQPGTNDQSGYSNQGESYEQSNSAPDNSTSEQYKDANGTTYITNNNYNGAYNDYDNGGGWYSTQINRWYTPYSGFGYYSPYYMGFNFYDPWYYSPGISISFGFGWGGYNSYYNPYYSYNPWYSPYYNPYYGYAYPYWYNPYYPGYGCGYGDGYGYGNGYGNNSYYGYHGSSASNTAGSDDGRHYRMADGQNGDAQQQHDFNRGNITDRVLQQPSGSGQVKHVDAPVRGNTAPSIENTPVKRDVQSNPKNDNPRNITVPDRNVPAPAHDNTPQRNGATPRQNNGQNPRQANFSQALNHQSQQQMSGNYQQQYLVQNENGAVANNERAQQQTGNVQQPVKQNEKKFYTENKNSSSKSSNNSQKQVQSNQRQQQQQVSHESVKQSAPQQRSDAGSRSNSQPAGRSSSGGGGNHNPR